MHRWCSSVSSPVTSRTVKAIRSSDRPVECSTGRWTRAGIVRDQVYVSNVVKHFKWSRSGKVRLHKKPNAAEIRACRQWWEAELEVVRPRIVCCLGATAAQALFGPKFRVTHDRGVFFDFPAGGLLNDSGLADAEAIATIHPSAVLRAPDERATTCSTGWSPTWSSWPPGSRAPENRHAQATSSSVARSSVCQ